MMASTKLLAIEAIRSSRWLFWGLWASLLTVYAPRGQNLPKMYFNMHLRRHARRLVNEDLVSYGVRTHSKSLPSMNTPRCVQQRAVKLRRSIT